MDGETGFSMNNRKTTFIKCPKGEEVEKGNDRLRLKCTKHIKNG